MAEKLVSEMFNSISSTYDRVNQVLSLGIDRKWRKKMQAFLPEADKIKLLDLATGTCDQLLSLMECGRIQQAVGIDLAEEMLRIGKRKVGQTPYADRVRLQVASAMEIPSESKQFSCVTISFGIRNVEDPLVTLKEMHRVLEEGGRALLLEFSLPKNQCVRALHLLYLRHILPAVGGLFSGKKGAYRYLNQTIESFPYGESFLKLMKEAGFSKAEAHPLTFGVATLYVGEKHGRVENSLRQ